MKDKIIKEFDELYKMILRTKDNEDLKMFNEKIEYINRLTDGYIESDKDELLKIMLMKNEEIKKMLQDKMNTLKHKLIQEDEQNRNRGTYKLYE